MFSRYLLDIRSNLHFSWLKKAEIEKCPLTNGIPGKSQSTNICQTADCILHPPVRQTSRSGFAIISAYSGDCFSFLVSTICSPAWQTVSSRFAVKRFVSLWCGLVWSVLLLWFANSSDKFVFRWRVVKPWQHVVLADAHHPKSSSINPLCKIRKA